MPAADSVVSRIGSEYDLAHAWVLDETVAAADAFAVIAERNGEQRHAIHLLQPVGARICAGRTSDPAGQTRVRSTAS